jgi:hypothetical protein
MLNLWNTVVNWFKGLFGKTVTEVKADVAEVKTDVTNITKK